MGEDFLDDYLLDDDSMDSYQSQDSLQLHKQEHLCNENYLDDMNFVHFGTLEQGVIAKAHSASSGTSTATPSSYPQTLICTFDRNENFTQEFSLQCNNLTISMKNSEITRHAIFHQKYSFMSTCFKV